MMESENGTKIELVYTEQHPQLDTNISFILWVIPLHNPLVGLETRRTTQNIPAEVINIPTAFPLTPIQLQFNFQMTIISRTQFPLCPGHATTSYKCQYRSMSKVIAHLQYTTQERYRLPRRLNITPDHVYVQCGRPSHASDLMLYPELPTLH